MYKLCLMLAIAILISPLQAGIVTFIGNNTQASWESAIGGVGAITGTEDFNSFTSDVPGNNAVLDLPLFTITSASSNDNFNIIDAPVHSTGQANQNGTTSFLGLQNVTIDFKDDLTALAFDYIDSGGASQNYGLRVNFSGGGSDTFFLGNPNPVEFRGITTNNGTLIDSITWILPSSPSPFSVDNVRVLSVNGGGGAVPEPTSVGLMVMALVFFCLRNKK